MNHLLELLTQGTNLSPAGFLVLCGVSFFWQRYCRRIRTWRRCVGSCDHGESSITDGVGADSRRGAACFKPKPGGFKLASNFDVDCGAVFNRLDRRRCSRSSTCDRAAEVFAADRYRGFHFSLDLGPKFQSASTSGIKFFIVGVITTIVTMFVGGTGVLWERLSLRHAMGVTSSSAHTLW